VSGRESGWFWASAGPGAPAPASLGLRPGGAGRPIGPRRPRAVIADDDPTYRTMLACALEAVGFEAVAVASGQEAWRLMAPPRRVPLAVLNWMLPDLGGAEILRRLRRTGSRPTLSLLMAGAIVRGATGAAGGLLAPAAGCLVKPFGPHEANRLARIAWQEVRRRTAREN